MVTNYQVNTRIIMAEFKIHIHIHGVPIGQDIWGPDEDQDYIQLFYNHDESIKEKSYMQIEVLRNKTFYSYLHKHNVLNSGGRSGSYFGITISFHNSYCTNVFLLYQIFEAIYEKKCLNVIIKDQGGHEQYIIRHFSDIQSDIEQISKSIIQHIDKYLSNNIVSLKNEIKHDQTFVCFNNTDVDSPAFIEAFEKYKIRVSPEYSSKEDELTALTAKILPLQAKYEELQKNLMQSQKENEILDSEKKALNRELNRVQTELISQQNLHGMKEQKVEQKTIFPKQYKQQIETFITENEKYLIIGCLLSNILLILCIVFLLTQGWAF